MFHFVCLLYETGKNIYNRINTAHPLVCKCFCANHAVCSGYNHGSKGLKKEHMHLLKLEYHFTFSPPLPKKENCLLCCCIKSVFKGQGCLFVNACGLSLIFPSSCVRANLRLRSPWRRRMRETAIGFYWCRKLNVCLFVAAGGSLFSTSNCDVSCSVEQTVLQGGRVVLYVLRTSSSPDFGTT